MNVDYLLEMKRRKARARRHDRTHWILNPGDIVPWADGLSVKILKRAVVSVELIGDKK